MIDECSLLASKWEHLGGLLGLPISTIDGIKKNYSGNSSDLWNETLKQWIKQNYKTEKFGAPSWRTLLKAVAKVDRLQLAADHPGRLEVL